MVSKSCDLKAASLHWSTLGRWLWNRWGLVLPIQTGQCSRWSLPCPFFFSTQQKLSWRNAACKMQWSIVLCSENVHIAKGIYQRQTQLAKVKLPAADMMDVVEVPQITSTECQALFTLQERRKSVKKATPTESLRESLFHPLYEHWEKGLVEAM